MRDHFFKATLTQILVSFLIVAALAACSDNSPSAGTNAPIPIPNAAAISLGTSANFILTDNANAAILTATLVDSSNAVMEGIPVSFSTTGGNLNFSTVTTDASGQAVVTLKSGLADFTNRTVIVTASVAGITPASIPILIRGSTAALTLTPSNTIQVGNGTLSATATATNAAGLGLSNHTIRFSFGAASTGGGSFSCPSPLPTGTTCAVSTTATPNDNATLTTDVTGLTPALIFTPDNPAGTVVLTADFVNSDGSVTSTTKDIIVTSAGGTAFVITTPAADPLALSSGVTQPLIATVPPTIAGVTVTDIRISATSGTWTGTSPPVGPSTSILQTQVPYTGAVAATYTAPLNSGSVTIQLDALGTVGGVPLSTLSSLTRTFVVSAPATAAAKLFLSATASSIVPSSGGNISTTTLEARVLDDKLNAVGGAAVMFGLLGTTGSGESVSPAVAITDSYGKATTTFSAGSAPTLAAIHAQASIVGEICDITSLNLPPATEGNGKCDTTPLMVSSSAVSVTVGFGSTVADTANATQYKLPGSVLVVNSNGSPVAGATVTLSVFPIAYRNGEISPGHFYSSGVWTWRCMGPSDTRSRRWDSSLAEYVYDGGETQFTAAEDANRNGILDAGEDTPGNGILDTWGTDEDVNGNGILDFTTEDVNGNGILDAGEDLNANNQIDLVYTEDVNGNGVLDANTEDVNGNGILDPGEDTPLNALARAAQAIGSNGLLSPPQAAGGVVPLTVTTDEFGAASFYLQYPKSSAWFIKDEVTARVIVMGTESTAKMELELPMSVPDALSTSCPLSREASY